MIETADRNDILAYALQRRALITQACEIFQTLGLPLDSHVGALNEELDPLVDYWAISVHPELLRHYRDLARTMHLCCHQLRSEDGVENVQHLEHLIVTDLSMFTRAIDLHAELPAPIQKRILDRTDQLNARPLTLSPLRMAGALPGVVLLAWDQAWREAIADFSCYAGETNQPPAVIDEYISRIDNLEESVGLMMNRFVALSAATEIPAEYRAE